MLPPTITVVREGLFYEVPTADLHRAGLRRDDLVLDANDQLLPASAFAALTPFVPPAPQRPDPVVDLLKGAAVIGGVALAGYGVYRLLDALLTPTPTERRSISMTDRDEVCRADGWRCIYCDRRVTRRSRHIDHAESLANGGADDWDNWVTACAPCNLSKGALNADEFVQLMG